MARVRAVEHDRAVVVASTTGISAIISPDGALAVSTGTWRQAEIEAKVPLLTSTTLADRLGGWPEGLLSWTTVALMGWLAALALRRRRSRDSGPSGTAAQ
jgi:apolipoprotein N-acyltransferase